MRLAGLILLIYASVAYSQLSVPADKPALVHGEWEFVPEKFLDFNDIHLCKSIKIAVPGVWNGLEWNGQKVEGQTYGTYFRKIHLPDSLKDLILHVPMVGLAYRVYVNDELIGQVGIPGTSASSTQHQIKPTTFHIPDSYEGKEVFLIFHISNFGHQNGGLWYAPEIGNGAYYRDNKIRDVTADLLILGSILIIMLYHFFIFILRPKERYSLYFSLACVCMIAYISTQSDIPLIQLFPNLSWVFVFKLTYSSLILVGPLNLTFTQSLFPSIISKKISKWILIIAAFFAILTWLIPTTISYYFILPTQLLLIAIGIGVLISLLRANKMNLKGSKILLTGLSFTLLTVIHDVLNSQFVITSIYAVHFGIFIYVLTLSMVLAQKFVEFVTVNERLKYELETLNEDLEGRVKKRTKEVHLQKELINEKNQKLEVANEELNDLMAVMAHDLKSPLININSLSELMKDKLDDSLKASGDMMQKIAKDGISIIENLISLKRIESENLETLYTEIDLTRLLKNKIEEFNPLASSKNQKIIYDLAKNVHLKSSKDHLNQIIANLLSNAIKFSPFDKQIFVKMEKLKEKIHISVRDEGPGFSEKDQTKVFGKFKKLSARPTAGESSSGLGLSIVKTLVDKLGGKIKLVSSSGTGAEFEITF